MSFWTDGRIEELKVRWTRGESARTIWHAMKAPSRSAVIGKVHRLKLNGQKQGAPRSKKAKPVHRGTHFVFVPENDPPLVIAPIDETQIPIEQRCDIGQLTEATCKWIYGDPLDAEHFYCGAMTVEDKPWCAYHARKATVPNALTDAGRRKRLSRLAFYR